ncbi:MAG: 23S rRNA (uracil(1939)-C(5))-methyltransferase RlmD [Fluviicoccus sp.]|uniref:23S rRNA (uracil(1939)-C(5))-methyltransferase RlmD n=1 Tax=Fluviicoccus sp. TaxID=2003552 RepID=UPI002728A478|nr:23S rRNA (uracil(1939)-C(5))-methyltransferase RlmD [Fluviicoccus sp.]MDO8329042.1 23S rRNA (uracil(1939)-C(5))-methyltransferase RlmD [Fluviicoccus sp.]
MKKKQRQRLKDQAPDTLTITRLSHEGRGIAHHDGKTVFVRGALAGETVTARTTLIRGKFNEADTVEVLEASPERAQPPCPHFGICGGCELQHMAPSAQIAFKQKVLEEQFRHFGNLQPKEWLPPMVHNTQDYRRKARLGVKFVVKKDSLFVGFREKGSPFLAELSSCAVLDQRIGSRIMALRELIGGMDAKDTLPQIEFAAGDESVALVFRHMEPLSASDQEKLVAFCRDLDWKCYLQPGNYTTVHRVWPLDGEDRLTYALPDFNLTMRFHPLDFTQVNAAINRQMVKLAIEMLNPQPHERVLDLFCGLGNFTLPLATRAGHVVGVEGDAAMTERGYENARHNNLSNVDFYAQDLTADFSGQPWAKEGFDALLIDPPRSGALEVVQYLPRFGAKRIVYVSCSPATLARDAGELAKAGYTLKKAGVMDMFTHTAHVESIALFEKG